MNHFEPVGGIGHPPEGKITGNPILGGGLKTSRTPRPFGVGSGMPPCHLTGFSALTLKGISEIMDCWIAGNANRNNSYEDKQIVKSHRTVSLLHRNTGHRKLPNLHVVNAHKRLFDYEHLGYEWPSRQFWGLLFQFYQSDGDCIS
jgi:hypothetical protein